MINNINNDLKEELIKNKSYPDPGDDDFQLKLYEKNELYYYKQPKRKVLKNNDEIQQERKNICRPDEINFYNHQILASNFINPNTPYKGLLIFQGLGTGKTALAISVGETFKSQVRKYSTKIYVLVNGPIMKRNFLNEIIKYKGDEYYAEQTDKSFYVSKNDKDAKLKSTIYNILQVWRIISYNSFYKKVLGEKIREQTKVDENTKKSKAVYRKTDSGEFERDISLDRIYNLNNTLIIVDEAHNLTGNAYGDALMKIIKNSNLKNILPDVKDKKIAWHFTYPNYLKKDDDISKLQKYLQDTLEN